MNEIEKMYENAKVEKIRNCKGCEYEEEYICPDNCPQQQLDYPPFTAEKQLELIKWLLKKEIDLTMNFAFMGNEYYISTDRFTCSFEKTFETTLARLINNLWQDLTEEEKEQIRRYWNDNKL